MGKSDQNDCKTIHGLEEGKFLTVLARYENIYLLVVLHTSETRDSDSGNAIVFNVE